MTPTLSPDVPRLQGKADNTYGRILDAAAHLFRANGYASVSLRAIAASADMKAGSLYYHFSSKEEIVTAILDAGIQSVQGAVRDVVDSLPRGARAAEKISAGIEAHLLTLLEHSDYTSANVRIFGQLPRSVQSANLDVRRDYERLWDDLLAELQACGELREGVDLHALRMLLIGSLNATLEWFDPEQGSVESLARSYSDILLQGVLGSAGGRS